MSHRSQPTKPPIASESNASRFAEESPRFSTLRARKRNGFSRNRGLTLIELIMAMAIMTIILGALGSLVTTSEQSFQYTAGYSQVAQHARVVNDRIAQSIAAAKANTVFPGAFVVYETVGSYAYPDALVVWKPGGTPANPDGLPLFSETVIYTTKSGTPNQLVEITASYYTSSVPALTSMSAWQTAITSIKKDSRSTIIKLTDLLRTCAPTSSSSALRGALRFAQRLRPSDADITAYKAQSTITTKWTDLAWPQGIVGPNFGMRQSCVRWEFQLAPTPTGGVGTVTTLPAVPFFGSACIYYQYAHP